MNMNETQIMFLEYILEQKGIKNPEIKDEILDHLIFGVEKRMENGILFHDAIKIEIDNFGEDNFKEILENRRMIFRKKNKKILLRIAATLIFIFPILAMLIFYGNKNTQENNVAKSNQKIKNKNAVNITNINDEYSFAEGTWKEVAVSLKNMEEPPIIFPLKGEFPIVATFGQRRHPVKKDIRFHKGIDIKAPLGTLVVAASDGKIKMVKDQETGYGKHIIIEHDDSFTTLYGHLSEILVEENQEIKSGEVIGKIGTSGASVLPHLHFEIRKENVNLNPEKYIQL